MAEYSMNPVTRCLVSVIVFGLLMLSPAIISADEAPDTIDTIDTIDTDNTEIPDDKEKHTSADSAPTDTSSAADSSGDSLTSSKQQRDSIAYEAEQAAYDLKNSRILLTGECVVYYGTMELYADTIFYLPENKKLTAYPNPVLIDRKDTVTGNYMTYNLETKRGKVKHGTASSDDMRYTGNLIARSDDNSYYIKGGEYTTSRDLETPQYTFYSKKIKVTPENKAIAKPAILSIGESPVAALPYFMQPMDKGRSSGFLKPKWGGRPGHGGRLENLGYYWAINEYLDAKTYLDVREFERYSLNMNSNYKLRYWFNGSISGSYTLTDNVRALNRNWELKYNHSQNLLPDKSLTLRGSGSIVSSKEFNTNYSDDTTDIMNQTTNADMTLSKDFRDLNANAYLKWNRTHNFRTDRVSMNVPGASFNLNSRPLFPFISDKEEKEDSDNTDKMENPLKDITWNYRADFYNKTKDSKKNIFDTVDISYSGFRHSIPVNAPMQVFRHITFKPFFKYSHALYNEYHDTASIEKVREAPLLDTLSNDTSDIGEIKDSIIEPDSIYYIYQTGTEPDTFQAYDTTEYYDSDFRWNNAHRYYWETGAGLSTDLYGIFPLKIFNFEGLRHTLSPSVRYSFVPKIEKNLEYGYPNAGVSVPRSERKQQRISFSLGNKFDGKIQREQGVKGKKENTESFSILNSSLSTSYDFEAETRKWSDISFSASTRIKGIRLSYSSRFTPYNTDDELIFPELMHYSLSIDPGRLSASGNIWGGDLLVFNGVAPDKYEIERPIASKPSWRFSLRPSFSVERKKQSVSDTYFSTEKSYNLRANAEINFTNNWRLGWGTYYDFKTGQFESQNLNFYCDLGSWDMKFNWNPTGVNQGSFYFIIAIKEHREVKWEIQD